LDYAVRRVQENRESLKFNAAHHLLAYADGINIVGENVDTIKKNTKDLLDASKVSVEVNAEKTKSIKIGNVCSEDVAKFNYLGATLTDQSCMHEEIKSMKMAVFWLVASCRLV
jgi:hypothetical protein